MERKTAGLVLAKVLIEEHLGNLLYSLKYKKKDLECTSHRLLRCMDEFHRRRTEIVAMEREIEHARRKLAILEGDDA